MVEGYVDVVKRESQQDPLPVGMQNSTAVVLLLILYTTTRPDGNDGVNIKDGKWGRESQMMMMMVMMMLGKGRVGRVWKGVDRRRDDGWKERERESKSAR